MAGAAAGGNSWLTPADDALVVEPIEGDSQKRNHKGLFIAFVIIIAVIAGVVVAVYFMTPDLKIFIIGDPVPMNALVDVDYQPNNIRSSWIKGTNILAYQNKDREIIGYDAETNESSVIMDSSTFRRLGTDKFWVSPDGNFILIAHDTEKITSYSYKSHYSIYDRYSDDTNSQLLKFPSKKGANTKWRLNKLQFAGWSKTGQSLLFIYDNDIYYQETPTGEPKAVTDTGLSDTIFNGITDWLYGEEIFSTNVLHWWSPDSTYLCYAQIDDTNVPLYTYPLYDNDTAHGEANMKSIPYPTVSNSLDGGNPLVTIYVVKMVTLNETITLQKPKNLGKDIYLIDVNWADQKHILLTWLNREQTKSITYLCDVQTGSCIQNHVESIQGRNGWIEWRQPIIADGKYFSIFSERDGHLGYWKHIARVSTMHTSNGALTYMTQGPWEVTEILAYNELTKDIYFLSNNGKHQEQHLFKVKELGHGVGRLNEPECLTCDRNDSCKFVSALFSDDAQYYVLHCLGGPDVPLSVMCSSSSNFSKVLERNHDLKIILEKTAQPIITYHMIKDKIYRNNTIWIKLYMPPSVNPNHIVKYPLLIEASDGAGSHKVSSAFEISWPEYLTTAKEIIYAKVDGYGTSGRGDEMLYSIYKKHGILEGKSLNIAVKFLKDKFSFIDDQRVAIWGQNFGGFLAIQSLEDNNYGHFGCGIALSPIVNWKNHNTAYTEKYMGLLSENYKGYDDTKLTENIEHMRNKHLLIIHGTADEKVHFQHTAQLIKSFTKADIEFNLKIYVDAGNNLLKSEGVNILSYMYKYLQDMCWDGGEPRIVLEEEADE